MLFLDVIHVQFSLIMCGNKSNVNRETPRQSCSALAFEIGDREKVSLLLNRCLHSLGNDVYRHYLSHRYFPSRMNLCVSYPDADATDLQSVKDCTLTIRWTRFHSTASNFVRWRIRERTKMFSARKWCPIDTHTHDGRFQKQWRVDVSYRRSIKIDSIPLYFIREIFVFTSSSVESALTRTHHRDYIFVSVFQQGTFFILLTLSDYIHARWCLSSLLLHFSSWSCPFYKTLWSRWQAYLYHTEIANGKHIASVF